MERSTLPYPLLRQRFAHVCVLSLGVCSGIFSLPAAAADSFSSSTALASPGYLTANPYASRRAVVRSKLQQEAVQQQEDLSLSPAQDFALPKKAALVPQESSGPLKVVIPNVEATYQKRHSSNTQVALAPSGRIMQAPAADYASAQEYPRGATENESSLAAVVSSLIPAPLEDMFKRDDAPAEAQQQKTRAADVAHVAPPGTSALMVAEAPLEKIVPTGPASSMAQIQPYTPEQLAQLAPAAGDAQANTPLIQWTDEAAPATPGAPAPVASAVPAPAAVAQPVAAAPAAAATAPLLNAPADAVVPAPAPAPAQDSLPDLTPLLSGSTAAAPEAAPAETPAAPAAVIAAPEAPKPADAAVNTLDTIVQQSSDTAAAPPAEKITPPAPAVTEKKISVSKSSAASNPKDEAVVSEPVQGLSKESQAILKKIPANLDKPAKKSGSLDISRAKDTQYLEAEGSKAEVHNRQSEAMGIKIEVKNRAIDWNYELEKAYEATMSGNTSEAIEIYKRVLETNPKSTNALFGLATLYHRAGQLDLARPLYGKLIALDPDNRDALNNFLVLLSDEAPEEALVQLEKLQVRNPEFSPIPAQMAVIYQKLGNMEKASQQMFRAIALAPENITYRYNLAIMMDKQKNYQEAAKLYRQIVEAHHRGEKIPGNIQKIQERLTFIGSNRP